MSNIRTAKKAFNNNEYAKSLVLYKKILKNYSCRKIPKRYMVDLLKKTNILYKSKNIYFNPFKNLLLSYNPYSSFNDIFRNMTLMSKNIRDYAEVPEELNIIVDTDVFINKLINKPPEKPNKYFKPILKNNTLCKKQGYKIRDFINCNPLEYVNNLIQKLNKAIVLVSTVEYINRQITDKSKEFPNYKHGKTNTSDFIKTLCFSSENNYEIILKNNNLNYNEGLEIINKLNNINTEENVFKIVKILNKTIEYYKFNKNPIYYLINEINEKTTDKSKTLPKCRESYVNNNEFIQKLTKTNNNDLTNCFKIILKNNNLDEAKGMELINSIDYDDFTSVNLLISKINRVITTRNKELKNKLTTNNHNANICEKGCRKFKTLLHSGHDAHSNISERDCRILKNILNSAKES